MDPRPLSHLLPMFHEDYFLYWGRLHTVRGDEYAVRWLVPRTALYASYEQVMILFGSADFDGISSILFLTLPLNHYIHHISFHKVISFRSVNLENSGTPGMSPYSGTSDNFKKERIGTYSSSALTITSIGHYCQSRGYQKNLSLYSLLLTKPILGCYLLKMLTC